MSQGLRLEVEQFGREVVLVIDGETDSAGQFRVALYVDEKERYAGHFMDKTDE